MGVCTLLAKTRARNGEVCVQVCGVCVGMNREGCACTDTHTFCRVPMSLHAMARSITFSRDWAVKWGWRKLTPGNGVRRVPAACVQAPGGPVKARTAGP